MKYLGRTSDIRIDKIPIEYRNDAKILSFLSSTYASKNYAQKDIISISKLKIKLFEAFSDGNLGAATAVYRNYCKYYDVAHFYENLLKPVMYQVGDMWEQKNIDVATEHVCSNVARGVIQTIIDETASRTRKDQTILLCSPEGEQHNLGCCVMESILLARGYRVLNASPSAPSDSIIRYIKDVQLDAILISVTLFENMGSAERLIGTIRAVSDVPILIGGQALFKVKDKRRNIIISSKVRVIEKIQLDEMLRLIREVIRHRK